MEEQSEPWKLGTANLNELNLPTLPRAAVFNVQPDQQHQHHLGTCFLGSFFWGVVVFNEFVTILLLFI